MNKYKIELLYNLSGSLRDLLNEYEKLSNENKQLKEELNFYKSAEDEFLKNHNDLSKSILKAFIDEEIVLNKEK